VLDVQGLDVAKGLHFVGGRWSTYIIILRMFAEQQAGMSGEIRRALAAGDREAAMHLVHSAKGILGTIGAERLHEDASALYRALSERLPPQEIESQLNGMEARHDALIHGLRAQLPAEPAG